MIFRDLGPCDLPECFEIRALVRENPFSIQELHDAGITVESVTAMLANSHRGWVCEVDGQIAGFAMADRSRGELWVIAVREEFQGRGIGRQLMELAEEWLQACGWKEIWLVTSPDTSTRAYALYRRRGWEDEGIQDGQRVMRLRLATI